MNSQTYNPSCARTSPSLAGLADLTASAQTKKAQRTSAQENHFFAIDGRVLKGKTLFLNW